MSENKEPEELPDWITDHIKLYLEDPEKGHYWDSTPVGGPGVLPILLLTTTGRHSGQSRLAPLIYLKRHDGFVVVASKGGAPAHPAWYLNLIDKPDCGTRVGQEQYRATARTTQGNERAELWEK